MKTLGIANVLCKCGLFIKLEIRMKKIKLILIPALITLLSACGSGTPKCDSSNATELLTSAIGSKLKEMGAYVAADKDISKNLSINTIETISHDEKMDTYVCKAQLGINLPSNYSEKLSAQLTKPNGIVDFEKILKDKLGPTLGQNTYLQITTVLSQEMISLGMESPGKSDAEYAKTAITEFSNMNSDPQSKVAIDYRMSTVKDDGKAKAAIRWTTKDDGSINVILLMNNISNAL